MKKIIFNIFIASTLITFSSCDKIDDPIPENIGNSLGTGPIEFIIDPSLGINDTAALSFLIDSTDWVETAGPDNSNTRFIILEEFTGHTCQNCPLGTREIIRLDKQFGDQLIPIGIHAGTFARFTPSASKYFTDFTVEGGHGETYSETFNKERAFPRGMVNRLRTAGGNSKGLTEWSKDINAVVNEIPLAGIELTNYFDSTKKIIRANVKIEWKQTLPENYSLQVLVVEDHITDWQKDDTDSRLDIPDYDHRHVLRKVVNDTFGKLLKPAVEGEEEIIEYIFPFRESLRPNNNKNIEVVVYIFRSDDIPSYEIIQANAAHIVNK